MYWEILKGVQNEDKKELFYAILPSESMARQLEKELAGGNNKGIIYDYVVVNEDLPELTGSEKQIAWAKDIRKKNIYAQINNFVGNDIFRVTDKETVKRNKETLMARMGVDNFSDLTNKALTVDPNGAFNYYKITTSAKEIIESRDLYSTGHRM